MLATANPAWQGEIIEEATPGDVVEARVGSRIEMRANPIKGRRHEQTIDRTCTTTCESSLFIRFGSTEIYEKNGVLLSQYTLCVQMQCVCTRITQSTQA